MRKTIFVVLFLVAASCVGQAQTWALANPAGFVSLGFKNMVFTNTGGDVIDFSGGGWVEDDTRPNESDPDPCFSASRWTAEAYYGEGDPSQAFGYTANFDVIDWEDPPSVELLLDMSGPSGNGRLRYKGPNLNQLSLVSSSGIVNPPQTLSDIFEDDSFVRSVDYMTASGYLPTSTPPPSNNPPDGGSGGSEPLSGGSSSSSQVTQTTDGLILQEGQFYPLDSQPQQ